METPKWRPQEKTKCSIRKRRRAVKSCFKRSDVQERLAEEKVHKNGLRNWQHPLIEAKQVATKQSAVSADHQALEKLAETLAKTHVG